MQLTTLPTNYTWVQIATGVTIAVVQATGRVEVGFTGTGAGFDVPSGIPVSVPNVADFGGVLWARGTGVIRHETA